jgi:mannose-6-phosphate isomerase class I
MGTHSIGPASLFSSPSTSLSAVIKSNPEHYLGSALLKKWPNTTDVPFLFKILSIRKALPLQAHPDKELGVILNKKDPKEFVDANHKPEIAVAVGGEVESLGSNKLGPETEKIAFTGFIGFQPLQQIAESVKNVPELRAAIADEKVVEAFTSAPSKDALKALYSRLLTRGKEQPDAVKAEVEKLVKRVASSGWGEVADEATAVKSKLVIKVNEQYPGDVGVLACPFFMNLVRLKRGQSVYIGADEVHAYLEGGKYLLPPWRSWRADRWRRHHRVHGHFGQRREFGIRAPGRARYPDVHRHANVHVARAVALVPPGLRLFAFADRTNEGFLSSARGVRCHLDAARCGQVRKYQRCEWTDHWDCHEGRRSALCRGSRGGGYPGGRHSVYYPWTGSED